MSGVIDVHADDEDRQVLAMDEDDLSRLKASATTRKGRGFNERLGGVSNEGGFDTLQDDGQGKGPQKSIEGWIVFVSGVHEEAQEPDIRAAFEEYGEIKNLHLNLDRRTGFVKGYCLVEYEQYKSAQNAVTNLNGTELLGKIIHVNWAFVKSKAEPERPKRGGNGGNSGGRNRQHGGRRGRDSSP